MTDRKTTIENDLSLDPLQLYVQGEEKKQEEHETEEAKKLGSYRIGSSGVVLGDGTVTGTCPRKTYLRFHGVNWDQKDVSDFLMMEQGVWNEEIWVDVLKRSWTGKILQEEEVPVVLTLKDGTKITGRPDVVLADDDEKPLHGLELKNASSVWTGRDALLERKPKVDHLIQAGMYMYGLQVPFTLCYVSRSKYAVPTKTWIESLFPRPDQPGSEWMEYNDKGGSKALKPFLSTFPLRLVDGTVEYWADGAWHSSIIEVKRVLEYYEGVHSMREHDDLPSRPTTLKVDGSKGFNPCDPAYCPLSETCERWESKGRQAWEDAVRAYAKEIGNV